ncbi:IS1202 transposase [Streptococcus pneumoniae]|nr:IS1202 transposase [Streptococcus pneumoniae]
MNETKKYLVIKAIAQGKKTKKRACVELNLSERQINRLLLAYQQKGKEAFRHGNRNRKPKHAIPDEIKERILKKYLSYETYKPNVLHFCELLAEEEGIKLSDTTVEPLSPPVFLHISTHFTATHGIPLSPLALKLNSFQSLLWLSHSL